MICNFRTTEFRSVTCQSQIRPSATVKNIYCLWKKPSVALCNCWRFSRAGALRRIDLKRSFELGPKYYALDMFPYPSGAGLHVGHPEGYIANCAAIRDFDVRQTVAAIQVPTLVIAGTHDAATTPADGHHLADRIAGARYVELNAAHLSNIEVPERFSSEVSSFLAAR